MIKKVSQNNKRSADVIEYVVDTIDDVKKLPKSGMGSTVFVIATKNTYMCDSTQMTWHNITISTGEGGGIVPPTIECDCVSEMTIWGEISEQNMKH